jgi:hypothetical protein
MAEQDLFLSMVSGEFRSYRELLTKDLERGQVVVSTQEKWGTLGGTTLEKLDHHLSLCSAVIHLVGDGIGVIPPEAAIDGLLQRRPDFLTKLAPGTGLTRELLARCSYTQFEAYLSVYHGRRLHIYRPDPKAPRDPGFASDDGQRESQRLHFERIRNLGRDRDVFLSQERLSSFVLADLRDILPALAPRIDVPPTRLRHTAERLVGREAELTLLDDAWNDTRKNVVVIWGKGGEGKTALVATWMAELALKDWRGAERVLSWSFYSQGTRDQASATAEVFINDALTRLNDPDPNQGGPEDRAGRLAALIAARRCLLVLDGLEPLQYPPGPMHGALKDPGMAALLRGLAARNAGLCVVTTREKVDEIRQHYARSAVDHPLEVLSDAAGAQVLHDAGARRAGKHAIAADDRELKQASREVGGHALTLALMGQFLRLTEEGDIRRRDRMKLAEADREYKNDRTRHYGHAFKAIEAYERWFAAGDAEARRQLSVLRLLGLFDRPAPADCLAVLRGGTAIPDLTDDWAAARDKDWRIALGRLQEINLIAVSDDGAVNCHPLLREYFATRLTANDPDAFRAAHGRLFEHLCASEPHRPETLPGLQPLYQAVTHGCLAGRQQEACEKVYRDRILRGTRGDGFYSTSKLGAFGADLGAVAAFFEEPWRRLAPNLSAPDQAWLLNEAAWRLRALGRLTEAVEPMRVACEMAVARSKWKHAAAGYSNLSDLEVTLGRLVEAVADGRRAIGFADSSGEAFHKISKRAAAADALHQAGERVEAGVLFAEAERMQAVWQSQFPRLSSLQGFRYADWLLAPAERAAWGCISAPSGGAEGFPFLAPSDEETPHAPVLDACADAEGRANFALPIAQGNNWLLDIALDHLTLARAALYRSLVGLPADRATAATPLGPRVATALDALRQANRVDDLPMALLTAALYHGTLGGDPAAARRLLDEAEQIAERGPMPLYLADVSLHRARLFRDRTALAEARRLIEQHGYGRRRDELADAEAAAAHW